MLLCDLPGCLFVFLLLALGVAVYAVLCFCCPVVCVRVLLCAQTFICKCVVVCLNIKVLKNEEGKEMLKLQA